MMEAKLVAVQSSFEMHWPGEKGAKNRGQTAAKQGAISDRKLWSDRFNTAWNPNVFVVAKMVDFALFSRAPCPIKGEKEMPTNAKRPAS
jgi:hypothetical protein